uniref:Protein phosphatase 1, regulatory subunit 26 n=1 Tax=Jaculus jaculus TaxID=51337 RepID=A0A8C5P5T5_JACJA
MFLMNAPPVVALQSRWEAFGQPRSFHLPDCFSESKEDVARASVSARVQMIISTLQRDKAVLGMSNERPVQRGQRAERCRGTRPAASPAARREQPAFPACGLPAHCDLLGKDQVASLGSSEPDSDSDDSVDRDIEEAIQEYLRARGVASGPLSQGAPIPTEPAHSSTILTLGPPKLALSSGSVPGDSVGASAGQGSTSPVSVSSEDSFEQSIRAEIEQFLSEKRQHEPPKGEESLEKKSDQNQSSVRLKVNREPPARAAPQPAPTGTCKEFVFRKPPRLAKMSGQPKDPVSTRPAAPRPEATQSRGGARRSTAARRSPRVRSSALVQPASDSSSDDGIEEAIQLYQLEKTRKEAGGDVPPRAQLQEERGPDPPSALPEVHRRPPNKKKPVALKVVDSTQGCLHPDQPSKLQKDVKASAPPVHAAARSEPAHRATCRADTSAELMCAEAILDISKTILPAPAEGSDRPPSASPLLSPPGVAPPSDGDSSAIDSDDSIEQEIRTFLALKAQVGSPQPSQGPASPPGPNSQPGILKAPLSKTPDLPLSCKRKRRGRGGTAVPKKTRGVRERAQDIDHKAQPSHDGRDPPGQAKPSEAPGGESEARRQLLPLNTVGLSDGQVSQGHGSAGEKESSEDKSSSLDSDEDLDTAIKDLLRSKRKLKKRCRDPRATCKKKVRFGTTEMRFGEKPGSLAGDWKDHGGPQVLRSCLSKCRRDSRDGPGRGHVFSNVAEKTKPGGAGGEDAPLTFLPRSRSPGATLLSRDQGGSECPALAPQPVSEDSSVDSDDSIELEIRRFLAEKAKESVRESPAPLQLGGPARPEAPCRKEPTPGPQPGVCTRSQRARAAPQLAEGGRGSERVRAQVASFLSHTGKSTPRSEQTPRLPAAPGRCEPSLPRGASGGSSAKGPPACRRNVCAHKDQSLQGAEPSVAESAFTQLPRGSKAGTTEAGSARGTFHVNYGNQSLLTPSPGPQANLTLPWNDFTHQSRLPNPWALNSSQGTAWTGVFGGEKEKGTTSQARGPPSLTSSPRKNLPSSGFSPLLSTQLFHFGKSFSWGSKQSSLFSPHLSLPLQGPAFSAFRESQPGRGPVFGNPHLLVKKDSGHWPTGKAQCSVSVRDRRNSGSEDSILDLRYGHRADRDNQDREALGSDASEFSDASVEEGGSSAKKGRVLKL